MLAAPLSLAWEGVWVVGVFRLKAEYLWEIIESILSAAANIVLAR